MSMDELIEDFIFYKKDEPLNVNELLDFIQLRYLQREYSLSQYCFFLRELQAHGAEKPEYFIEA